MKRYLLILGLFLGAFALAQMPTKLVNGLGVERVVGASGVEYDSGMVLVPSATLTALTTATTKVQVIWCNNVTTIVRTYAVTTITAATSFVITASAAPITNPACLSYTIVN